MKFTCTVTIEAARERVVELFMNPDNLKIWQDGFVGYEPISGRPGKVGSTTRLKYETGKQKRRIELIETILVNDLPHEFTARYESYMKEKILMVNTMQNTFEELAPSRTRYQANVEYTEFHGFMMKMMAFFFPGFFKKQVQTWLNRFKDFAEREEMAA